MVVKLKAMKAMTTEAPGPNTCIQSPNQPHTIPNNFAEENNSSPNGELSQLIQNFDKMTTKDLETIPSSKQREKTVKNIRRINKPFSQKCLGVKRQLIRFLSKVKKNRQRRTE